MREYTDDGGLKPRAESLDVNESVEIGATPDDAALIFDYTDSGYVDLPGLSILFTAGELARKNNQTIWVAGLPRRFWVFLHTMGLEGYFKPFPTRKVPDA